MKRKIYLSVFLLTFAITASSQFVPKPLNFPGTYYYPDVISIVDHNHAWFGTIKGNSSGNLLPYPFAIHTNDGGETFVFDSIPAEGSPYILDVSAVDSSICYYAMTNSYQHWSIWKTTDGGNTWQKKTTTQFEGGYLDVFYAFSADTGVAIGDPNLGSFEIQITNDSGNSWTRVPSANIPQNQSGEYSWSYYHCALGNTIWFPTNKGRCFKSVDKGLHWTVSTVLPPSTSAFDVRFASPDNGVFYPIMTGNRIYKTTDGGTSWVKDSIPLNESVIFVSPVSGFNEGFVFTTTPDNILTDVYFTPDFFHTVVFIQSGMDLNGPVSFSDAETGWLTGSGTATDDIYYYTDVLTSVFAAAKTPEKLSIIPNPSATEALVKLPSSLDSKSVQMLIIDMNGKVLEQHAIASSTGWTKLNAGEYANGNYIVELVSGNQLVVSEKWVVNH